MSRQRSRPSVASGRSLDVPAAALLAALVAVPSYFNIQSNTSFEPDKGTVIRSLAVLALLPMVVEVWRHWRQGELRNWRPGLSFAVLGGLVVVAGLATLASVDPVTSFWGGYERSYGWLAVLVGAILVVVAYRSTLAGHTWLLVEASLIGATVPALYGLLQFLGYDPVRGQTVSFVLGQRASSTLGNPLFLADYLLLALLLGLARLVAGPRMSRARRMGLIAILLLLAGAFAATGSRSGLFAVVAATTFLLMAEGQRQGRRWVQAAGLLVLLAVGALLGVAWAAPQVLPSRLGDLFASGGTGGQRLLIWQGVMSLLGQEPRYLALGVGPDALPLRLAPYLPAQLAHFEVDWVFRVPDRAHTYPLDLLTQSGIIGLLGWSLFWAAVFARVLPRPARRWPAYLPILLQLAGAFVVAGVGWVLAGAQAAPLGWMAGFLGGGILTFLAAPRPQSNFASSGPALAPFLLAALAGHWLLLTFSFNTHAADLLVWTIAGLALALGREPEPAYDAPSPRVSVYRLAGIATATVGFSLSAALPPALLLWLSSLLLLYLVATCFAAGRVEAANDLSTLLLPVVLLLPALWLNRSSGLSTWLAYAWFVVWLVLQVALLLPVARRRASWSLVAAAVVIVSLLSLPTLGDIAFKSAILEPNDVTARDRSLHRALLLSPYDHILAAGIVPTEALSLPAEATLDHPQAQRIAALYERAYRAQPLAPEAIASYAEWLRQRSVVDPAAASLALTRFDQALQLSPNDVETRNHRALLVAGSGNSAAAEADLRALLALDPLYGPTYRNLARVQLQEGNRDGARRTLEQGVANVPWWPDLRSALDELP